jgi:hypothetical protein
MTADAPRTGHDGVTVLYVAGKGRSGTTLVDTLLGQVDGFFSTGELCHVWDHGIGAGFQCGCSQPVERCPVWTQVFARMEHHGAPAELARMTHEILSWRRVPRLLITRSAGRWPLLDHYVRVMADLYGAIAAVTGARVIVDSSKRPANPLVLGLVPRVSPVVVHLVRDPRAVAFSWSTRKARPDALADDEMPRFNPLYSALGWDMRHATAEVAARRVPGGRHLRITYEDLVADPAGVLGRVVELAGGDPTTLPLAGGSEVNLAPTHTVGGNPFRMRTGTVGLVRDDRWLAALEPGWRRAVTAATLPMLVRSGYPVRAPAPDDTASEARS